MIDLDMFFEGGIDMNSTSDIKVGDKVRITYTGTGLTAVADNLGKLAEVVEVDQTDVEVPIRVKFLGGDYEGTFHWLYKSYFNLVKEVEGAKMDKIKEGDFVVIDTTHSEDSKLDGLHGKVVQVIEVDPSDPALPINVVLPNGDSRWMYPEEFHSMPESDFNILVDSGKVKHYGEASGSVVPVIAVDCECPMGFFFKAKSDGELLWVNHMDCTVLLPEGEDPTLFNEEVELNFTVLKQYANGEVSNFVRIDKQSKHFYNDELLVEFNEAQSSYLTCKSKSVPEFWEEANILYLRGRVDERDDSEILIPDECLEQVVVTLVDLKAWMLNRCKR